MKYEVENQIYMWGDHHPNNLMLVNDLMETQ